MTTYLISTKSTILYGLETADTPEQALDQLAADANLDRTDMGDCTVYAVPAHLVEAVSGFEVDQPADDPTFAEIVAANDWAI